MLRSAKRQTRKVIAVLMMTVFITGLVPANVFASSGIIITDQEGGTFSVEDHGYDTYYYLDGETPTINGESVTFLDGENLSYGETTLSLKNKELVYTISESAGSVRVEFSNVDIPAGSVSGLWNSGYGGQRSIVYTGDLPGMSEAILVNQAGETLPGNIIGDMNGLTISLPEGYAGTFNLTNGYIYEMANEWSPGIDFKDGRGTQRDNTFSRLPNLEITVTGTPTVKVTEITGVNSNYEVKIGETIDLEPGYLPENATNGNIQYSSDNGAIVSVDNEGKVTALAPGAATITVSSVDGGATTKAIITVPEEGNGNEGEDGEGGEGGEGGDETSPGDLTGGDTGPTGEGNTGDAALSYVPFDWENDLLLNSDYESISIGESYTIFGRRVEELVKSKINNDQLTVPNFNYEVIRGNAISLKELDDADQKAVATGITEGISVIKVTYDAVKPEWSTVTYGSSSAVNTAYMVIEVTEDPADVKVSSPELEGISTFDTIYFEEGTSTPYNFTVSAEGAETVEVTCNGEKITTASGSYTANLENRQNIIEITATKGGKTKTMAYMVDARKIEVIIENLSRPGATPAVGDEINVSFKGINLPVPKLAGLYNPQMGSGAAYIEYNMNGTSYIGKCGQWDLSTNNDFNVTLTEEGTITFEGSPIQAKWWGEVEGAHKSKFDNSYEFGGLTPDQGGEYGMMPDFSIEVKEYTEIEPTSITIDKKEISIEEKTYEKLNATLLPEDATIRGIVWESSDESVVTVDSQGNIKGVGPGTATVTAKSNLDRLENIKGTCEVTVLAEFPATESEREELKKEIELAKSIPAPAEEAQENIKETYKALQAEIVKAQSVLDDEKALIGEVDSAKDALTSALNDHSENERFLYSVTQEVVGDEVKIDLSFPLMTLSQSDIDRASIVELVFDSDLEGFEQIKSENKSDNLDDMGNLTFYVPTGTKAFTLSGGYLFVHQDAVNPQFWWTERSTEHFLGEMPEIIIRVGDVIDVETINIEAEADKIIDNGTIQLNAVISPENATNKKITWESSDDSIATVDNSGLVTGVGDGEVEITARANYGLETAKYTVVINVENIQARIDNVEKEILAIGQVNLESEAAIDTARSAYDSLTEEQKEEVSNYTVLEQAEVEFYQITEAYNLIEKLSNEVNLKTVEEIKMARTWYDSLSETGKAAITNLDKLVKLEKELEANKESLAKAELVVNTIEKIGAVSLENQMPIIQARFDYDNLTEEAKGYVHNYEKLKLAETEFQNLYDQSKADFVDEKIIGIGTVTLDKESLIEQARLAYDTLTENQQKLVSNYKVLTAAEEELKKRKAQEETGALESTKGEGDSKAPTASGTTIAVNNLDASEEKISETKEQALSATAEITDKDSAATEAAVKKLLQTISDLTAAELAQLEEDDEFLDSLEKIRKTLQTDDSEGVSITGVDWYAKLNSEETTLSEKETTEIEKLLNDNGKIYKVLDISLKDLSSGDAYDTKGAAVVTLGGEHFSELLGYKTIIAVHYDENGLPTYIKCDVVGGKIVFETSSFSKFAFIGYDGDWIEFTENNVPTAQTPYSNETDGLAGNNMIYILIAVGAVLLGTSIVLLKRGKNAKEK